MGKTGWREYGTSLYYCFNLLWISDYSKTTNKIKKSQSNERQERVRKSKEKALLKENASKVVEIWNHNGIKMHWFLLKDGYSLVELKK